MPRSEDTAWFDGAALETIVRDNTREDGVRVRDILDRARSLAGLELSDAAMLMAVRDPQLVEEMYAAARDVKSAIYGNRLVLFAPLYISSLCANECLYCAFRRSNPDVVRRALNMDEVAAETRHIVQQGHKRVLLVAGESYPGEGFDYVLRAIDAVYAVREGNGAIRRLNVNVAPLTVAQFTALKARNIGTYQLFQETYHRPTYGAVHLAGPKKDFDWRLSAMDRAMEAGIDDVGLGPLLGLHDWRFEILATLRHARHLEERFGVGCHTISVPRLEPAVGSAMATTPPAPVSDDDFLRLVAVVRLAVPYTGIIMSTRENMHIRRQTLALGVSQLSAGSRTNPGGYGGDEQVEGAQFQLGDHRTLAEVVEDVSRMGYLPSFCTACYRSGRTGHDFMELAKPGDIKAKCTPNGLATFKEYLMDYATPAVQAAGEAVIAADLARLDERTRRVAERMLHRVAEGRRDVFC